MSDRHETVTLQNEEGETKELRVRSGGYVTCPECGAEAPDSVEMHSLTRVLAGECAVCFHTWTIGVDNGLEVVDDA